MMDNLNRRPQATPPVPPVMQTRLKACSDAERAERETTWHLAGLGWETEAVPVLDEVWVRLEKALADEHPGNGRRQDRPQRSFQRHRARRVPWSLVILAAVIIVGIGVVQWRQPVRIEAPSGTTVTATLPDGSRAELNSGSALSYQRHLFGWTRMVRLDGEAFFEVMHAETPFVVETFNASVVVLGTEFNVRAWPNDDRPETTVVLQTGAVEMASRVMPEHTVRLEPGYMSRLPLKATVPTPPEAVSIDRRLAWRAGGLAFNNEPLGVIFADLERRFDVEIVARPPSIAQDSLVLFLAQPPNVEAVLEAISRFRGYRYRVTAEGYEITSR